MKQRMSLLLTLAIVLGLSVMAPVAADELDDLLGEAAEADYSGRRLIVTFIDGDTVLEIVDVEHAGSSMVMGSEGGELHYGGGGRLIGADGVGVAVSSWNSAQMSARYSLGDITEVRRLDRAATSVDVLEDGQLRMRLVFDQETGTPLVTEVYDGDGELFRLTSMLDVDSTPTKLYSAQVPQADEFDVVIPTSDHSLAASAGSYELADAYGGPNNSVQGFYTDGLFAFSLFVVSGAADSERLGEATNYKIDGRRYRRLVEPGEMWVSWASGGNTFVLVGDLPPDHLEAVLAELPKPNRSGFFSRLWNGIFG